MPPTVGTMKRAALSASRAGDYQQCPLRFRLRAVDQVPEPPSTAALGGTLVHAVLDHLFDLPAAERSPESAVALVEPQWAGLLAQNPEYLRLFSSSADLEAWLAGVRALVTAYFNLEDPRRLEPAARERFIEVELGSGLLLRGFVDRIDVAPGGALRVVDYKSGKAPPPRFTQDALFQMRFYALMLWRLEGVVPARLQLIYLGGGQTLTLDPTAAELAQFEEEVGGLWDRIAENLNSGWFPPRRSALCSYCAFTTLCPEFGGNPPPLPEAGREKWLMARREPDHA